MHFDNENEPKCNEKELRKCILKILLSQITKGIGFYRLHVSQIWLIIYESYKYKPEKGFNIMDKNEIDQVVLNVMEVKVVMRKI